MDGASNHLLALKEVVEAVDGSANPEASFTAMIVFFISASKRLDLDSAWVAFSNASTILEGGQVPVYDESLPDDDLPKKSRGKRMSKG